MNSHISVAPGILSDRAIKASAKWNAPLIKEYKEDCVQACSYDMRIGTVFHKGKRLRWRDADQVITIQPGDIICILTHEELHLPSDISATAYAMNHWSSQGLLVLNPGHVDPGFQGPLSVRLVNIRSTPKNISFGEPIFTVIFQKLPEEVSRPYCHNKPREDVERNYCDLDVEQNPGSLGKTIARGESPPFLSREQVRHEITEHWLSKCIFWFTLIAAATGLLLVILEMLKRGREIIGK